MLQVARLLSLLGIGLHLVLSSILLGVLGVVGIVSLGDHLVLVEVLFQGVGDHLFNPPPVVAASQSNGHLEDTITQMLKRVHVSNHVSPPLFQGCFRQLLQSTTKARLCPGREEVDVGVVFHVQGLHR